MRRPVSLILTIILLITCSGCFWEVEGEGHGEHDRGWHGEHERGGSGEHEGGEHEERR